MKYLIVHHPKNEMVYAMIKNYQYIPRSVYGRPYRFIIGEILCSNSSGFIITSGLVYDNKDGTYQIINDHCVSDSVDFDSDEEAISYFKEITSLYLKLKYGE